MDEVPRPDRVILIIKDREVAVGTHEHHGGPGDEEDERKLETGEDASRSLRHAGSTIGVGGDERQAGAFESREGSVILASTIMPSCGLSGRQNRGLRTGRSPCGSL